MLIRSWLFAIAVALVAPPAQQGYDLYQQALVKERAAGELDAAIALYGRIAKEFAADRSLVAKALLRMAGCYDQLGSPEAAKLYARIVSQFSDQADVVVEARRRLTPARPATDSVGLPPGLVRKLREPIGRIANIPSGVVSASGRHVALVATGNISIRDIGTGQTRPLTSASENESACGQLAWSRDSKHLAFNWCLASGASEVRAFDFAKGTTRTIVPKSPSLVVPLDWSPDGQSLLALFRSRPSAGSSELSIVSLADGRARTLKSSRDADLPSQVPRADQFSPDGRAALFSPDGRFVVFTPVADGRGVRVLEIETAQELPLLAAPRQDRVFGWTPAGSLLFSSDRDGTYDLWMVGFADGRAQGRPGKLVSDLGVISVRGLTDTGALYFLTASMHQVANSDLHLATLDAAAGTVVGSVLPVSRAGAGHLTHPVWSPNGRELAYKVGAAGTVGDIYIQSIETGQERRLDAALGTIAQFDWSPDGQSLVVGCTRDGLQQLVRVDVKSGEVSALVSSPLSSVVNGPAASPGRGGMTQPRWLKDGRSILFVSNTKVLMVELATGNQRTVLEAKEPIRSLAVSPDNSMVAYVTGTAVMMATLADGRSRQLDDAPDTSSAKRVTWSADGRFVVYSNRTAKTTVPGTALVYDELWRIPAVGGDRERMNLSGDSIFQPAMSPDGGYLAFSINSDARTALLVLDGFLPATEIIKR